VCRGRKKGEEEEIMKEESRERSRRFEIWRRGGV
jgi:hypothetical protein